MAIVALDKVTLYGTSQQKDEVVEGLQQLGCTHVVDLSHNHEAELPEFISKDARRALRLLESSPICRTKTLTRTEYDRDRVVADTLEVNEEREILTVERDQLEQAIADLQPWGNFSRPEPGELGGAELFFYEVPLRELPELPSDVIWHVANRDNRFAYVVVIGLEPPETMPGQQVELDHRSLETLRERLQWVKEELDNLHWERVSLTRWRRLLASDLDIADDKAAQAAAANRVLDDKSVFALQAWVPHFATDDVREFAKKHQLAITAEPARRDESPPTLLRNPKRVASAEDCVTFYITPGYHAWDPTAVMFFSLSLFFAMIVSDAGYGLVMLGIVLLLWQRLGFSPTAAKFRSLMLGIVTATIIYGMVAAGSYFGVEPRPGGLLDAIRIRIDGQPLMSNRTAMMSIAVAIGVGHLTLANVISAVNHRATLRWVGHLGWAMLMIGTFLLGVGVIWEWDGLQRWAKISLIVAGAAVLLFSSDEPLVTRSIKSHLLRLRDGFLQVMNVPKAFGDTLSYLRLFALGLASAQLAVTFNGLASDAFSAGGIGILMGLVILMVGHGINFLLGLMGGVVHGLRLNCIEFFNWSLTEEGYPFQPFKKKAEF